MSIPPNTIPFLIGTVVTIVVGIKSLQNYHRLHTPLSRHFAFTGFLAAAGLGFNSIPFYLTNNPDVLRICLTLGRLFLDLVGYWQIYLIWYLTWLRKYPLRYFVIPLTLLGIIGFVDQALYFQNNPIGLVDGLVLYKFSDLSRYIHIVSLMIVFVAGVVIGINAFQQTKIRPKVRLLSVSILYIFASMAITYTMYLQGYNISRIFLLGSIIAAGVFLSTTLIFRNR